MKLGRVLLFGASWITTATACGEGGTTCGALECDGGQLCVKRMAWKTEYLCADNPCESETIDCECAASACGADAFTCAHAEAREVACYCATC